MKLSLWDLKHGSINPKAEGFEDHEVIPMGFETMLSQTHPSDSSLIMKLSLWDLKPRLTCEDLCDAVS